MAKFIKAWVTGMTTEFTMRVTREDANGEPVRCRVVLANLMDDPSWPELKPGDFIPLHPAPRAKAPE